MREDVVSLGGPIQNIIFSLDGLLYALYTSGKHIYVYNTVTDELISELVLPKDEITNCFSFSDDNLELISGNDLNPHIYRWKILDNSLIRTIDTRNIATVLCISPNKQRIICGEDDYYIRGYDSDTGSLIDKIYLGQHTYVFSIKFNLDGSKFACGDSRERALVWDSNTFKQSDLINLKTDNLDEAYYNEFEVYCVEFHPHIANIIAIGSTDNLLRIWDLNENRRISLMQGHTDTVYCASFHKDGDIIATGSVDMSVRVWEVLTGALLQTISDHPSPVISVCFKGNNQILSADKYGNIATWVNPDKSIRKILHSRLTGKWPTRGGRRTRRKPHRKHRRKTR